MRHIFASSREGVAGNDQTRVAIMCSYTSFEQKDLDRIVPTLSVAATPTLNELVIPSTTSIIVLTRRAAYELRQRCGNLLMGFSNYLEHDWKVIRVVIDHHQDRKTTSNINTTKYGRYNSNILPDTFCSHLHAQRE